MLLAATSSLNSYLFLLLKIKRCFENLVILLTWIRIDQILWIRIRIRSIRIHITVPNYTTIPYQLPVLLSSSPADLPGLLDESVVLVHHIQHFLNKFHTSKIFNLNYHKSRTYCLN